MHAARCAREMRQWPDGIRVQRTHYAAISARLSWLCQGWNLHSVQGRCNWDTLSPSLVIGSQTQTGAGNYNDLGFILFSSHVRGREWIDKIQAISLGERESGARSKYFTIFLKIFYKNLCEAWAPPLGKVKSEIKIIVHKASAMKKVLLGGAEMWNGMWSTNWWHPQCLSSSRGVRDL